MTTEGKRKHESWADAPRVFVTLPSCPQCGSTNLVRVRTEANGDGSATRRMRCACCPCRFFLVSEIPEPGICELMPE